MWMPNGSLLLLNIFGMGEGYHTNLSNYHLELHVAIIFYHHHWFSLNKLHHILWVTTYVVWVKMILSVEIHSNT